VLPVRELCEASDERAIEIITAIGRSFQASAPTHRVSALQDLEAGRPLEIEETFGHAVAMARRLRVRTPLLEEYLDRLRVVHG
jgi:ketopantoate reductase